MTSYFSSSVIDLSVGQAPWTQCVHPNAEAETIHMSAANGFTVESYLEFLQPFTDKYSVTGMDCRGTWKNHEIPPNDFKMSHFADDLIEAIKLKHNKPIIGFGHSLGGCVTLIAAIKEPQLFSKIVLIEPASLPYRWSGSLLPLIPKRILFKLFPFIRGSLNRQRNWKSYEQFHARYRHHNTYKRFTDASFNNYMTDALEKKDKHLQLRFSPQWEAYIFSIVEFIWKYLANVSVPTLFIRAEHSNLYTHKQFLKRNKKLPRCVHSCEIDESFHLLPLENPSKTQNIINKWLICNKT